MTYSFDEQTIKVVIDQSRCPDCRTKACANGCRMYDRGILVIKDGIPMLREGVDPKKDGTECLACEEECRLRGFNVITIDAGILGLQEWIEKVKSLR